jgi:hypothetical protein
MLYLEQIGNGYISEYWHTYRFVDADTIIIDEDVYDEINVAIDFAYSPATLILSNSDDAYYYTYCYQFNFNPEGQQEIPDNDYGDPLDYSTYVTDLAPYLENTVWVSTGNNYYNPNAAETAPGYPREHDITAYEIELVFSNGNVEYYGVGGITSTHSLYYPSDMYVQSFHRDELVNGETRYMYSLFYVSGGYLYEIELMDDVECSNIIEYSQDIQ